jgi:hypothetical protein
MLSYSIGAIIEHRFLWRQGENVAGAVHRRGHGEKNGIGKCNSSFRDSDGAPNPPISPLYKRGDYELPLSRESTILITSSTMKDENSVFSKLQHLAWAGLETRPTDCRRRCSDLPIVEHEQQVVYFQSNDMFVIHQSLQGRRGTPGLSISPSCGFPRSEAVCFQMLV